MSDYALAEDSMIIRASDGARIPINPGNRDYAEYELWLAAGGVPDHHVRPPEEIAIEQRRAVFDADATRADLLKKLRSATPAQINSYVDNNVANLAEARALFKRILLVLAQV